MKNISIVAVLLCALLCAAGCRQGKERAPVPEEQMQAILLDMHLAEGYSLGLGDSTIGRFQKNYDTLTSFYASILKHHDLSFEEFNEALEWYKQRPERIDTLYSRVLNQLMELKAKAGIGDIEEGPLPDPVVDSRDTVVNKQDNLHTKIKSLRTQFEERNDTTRNKKISKPETKSEP